MKYEQATWRIKIGRASFLEISIKGCQTDHDLVEATDVVRAASILKDVGRSAARIAARWDVIEGER